MWFAGSSKWLLYLVLPEVFGVIRDFSAYQINPMYPALLFDYSIFLKDLSSQWVTTSLRQCI